jgi:hypothetical protein
MTVASVIAAAGGAYAAVRAEIRHLWADIRRIDSELAELRARLMLPRRN